MSDAGTTSDPAEPSDALRGELLDPGEQAEDDRREAVEEPAKLMRIGSMIKQLLEEVRSAELDEAARTHLKGIYETSLRELGAALSPDLRDELDRVTIPFGDGAQPPSEAELLIAQAQLVGWLEGLFHGIQATLFAQQMAARAQLEQMHQIGPGGPGGPGRPGPGLAGGPGAGSEPTPGTYL